MILIAKIILALTLTICVMAVRSGNQAIKEGNLGKYAIWLVIVTSVDGLLKVSVTTLWPPILMLNPILVLN